MKRAFLGVLLLGTVLAVSGETPQPSSGGLFIESDPLGSYIMIDGALFEGVTPVFIKKLDAKEHSIRTFKPGYFTQEKKVVVKGGVAQAVFFRLDKTYGTAAFPEEEEMILSGREIVPQKLQYRLPSGDYRISRQDGVLRFDAVFPQEALLNATALGIPLTLLLSGAMTIQHFSSPWNNKMPLSPMTVASYSLFLTDFLWFIGLSIQKAHFEESQQIAGLPASQTMDLARDLYFRGDKALADGLLDAAIQNYFMTVSGYPESSWSPQALFKMARLHGILGNTALAKAEYLMITDLYPVSDLYDKARKALADLSYAQGDYNEALSHLDEMAFFDPLITQEDVTAFRQDIDRAIKGGTGEK